jgi:hypothetical protein
VQIVRWFVGITLIVAFFFLIIGSPVHRYRDPLFWFMTANTFGLVFLSILLHNESSKDERARFIRGDGYQRNLEECPGQKLLVVRGSDYQLAIYNKALMVHSTTSRDTIASLRSFKP